MGLTYSERCAVSMLIWKSRGKLNGKPIRAGDEFFITSAVASAGVELQSSGDEPLEAFRFFPRYDGGCHETRVTRVSLDRIHGPWRQSRAHRKPLHAQRE